MQACYKGFHNLVVDTRNNDGIVEANGLVSFKKKLQHLKRVIRDWIATKRSDSSKLKKEHLSHLSSIDVLIDQGRATDLDLLNRRDSIRLLGDLDRIEATDLAQKARIKSALEGDENPCSSMPHKEKIVTTATKVSLMKESGLKTHITSKQFLLITFGTGPFPKGCNSSFIALIPKVFNATCISPEQSAFIKGRNILDGPLILNEVIEWYRKRKKQLMIFKVDFEKAFDSLRWDFRYLVMAKLGFGIRWRNWIKGCLRHARSSVLVNGSPTVEFEISRGLRQDDPLSPFLFILAMEGLHALICKALNCGIYTGAYIKKDNLRISHLIYADDVIFTGKWSRKNAHNLLCILRCFFLVSGLKINVHKSNILGICVSDEETSAMANVIGCGASKLPLKYLGVPVGCNMARCANWDVIINKFSSKLSHWKARMISVVGRLSLIKSVLSSLPTYLLSLYKAPVSFCSKLDSMRNNFFIGGEKGDKKMTWVSWNKCLASKNLEGLGIGSIFALNAGLLFKWIWWFMQNSTDLWARAIKAIYGHNGGIHADSMHSSNQGTWCNILSMVNSLKSKGIDLLSLCIRKLGNGASIRFWDDVWCGNLLLQNLIRDVVLSDHRDSWIWSHDISKGYTVASVRHLIDSRTLDVGPNATRWNRAIPIKVNVFLWRLSLNKLPSRVNLDKKGIDVDSLLCPICNKDVEMVNHLFFSFLAIWLRTCVGEMEKGGTLLSSLASKVKNINCDKASGVDSISINIVESDNRNVNDHGNYGNRDTKPISFASIFKEETNKKTVKLYALCNDEIVNGTDVAIPLMVTEEDEQCPKKVRVVVPTKVSDDGFVEVTRKHENGKQTSKTRHIDGVRLTKPKPNYYYRPISKSANVNGEASTSQPKENKDLSALQPNNKGKDVSDL
ncbi:RNA-directed DNA polymerase, eukaryota [Tanacetum coccineum]|uniref:RNA-directed DNA polymerase, eukaryota n=1 Tax=Tanacetum coccineum TaxID=301880 RepID=A0ABQ5HBZ5_9ASTR